MCVCVYIYTHTHTQAIFTTFNLFRVTTTLGHFTSNKKSSTPASLILVHTKHSVF